MIVLSIESSCDDTAAAVFVHGKLMANVQASQAIHTVWGGVVPELASRAHQQAIVPVVQSALTKSGVQTDDLDMIAYTQGPGLLGSLLVGQSFAKGLAQSLGIPLVGVNHMQAHVLALFIEEPRPAYPFMCLTVSGGHTQIVVVRSALDMEIIGKTLDDAAGEAFDKCAKMLGLPYPGGPLVDKLAAEGNPHAYIFPISNISGLDYSFSGLKTAVMNFVNKQGEAYVQQNLKDICASIQHTIIETLLRKLILATKQTGIKRIGLAGGVSANRGLRVAVKEMSIKEGWQVFIPKLEYCTDNAAMIGMAGIIAYEAGRRGAMDDGIYTRQHSQAM